MSAAAGGYRVVVRLPGAVPAFAAAGLARLCYGVLPLALLLFVSSIRGSYADAGAVAAGYGLTAAVLGPARARACDRFGAARMLVALGALLVGGFGLLVAVVSAPLPVVVAVAVLAGCAPPPVGPVMRSVWRRLAGDDEDVVRAAYALDAVAEEVLFVAGPLLGGLLVAGLGGGAVVVGTTGVLLLAVLAMAGCGAVRGWSTVSSPTGRSSGSPWRAEGFVVGLGPVTGLGLLLGAVEVAAVAAVVAVLGERAGGWPGAVVSAGSLVGGIVYGQRRWPGRTVAQAVVLSLTACFAVLVAGLVALGLRGVPSGAPGVLAVLAVLGVAGLALSPAIVVSYLLADERAPVTGAESTAWVNSAFNVGVAAGASLAGLIVDASGPAAALVVGALLAALLSLAAVVSPSSAGPTPG